MLPLDGETVYAAYVYYLSKNTTFTVKSDGGRRNTQIYDIYRHNKILL